MSKEARTPNDYRMIIVGLLMAVLILSIAVLSSVPPVSRDALVHHLAVPKLWLQHGGIYEMSDKVFSYYPMTLDLLYTIPLYFNNDILPKFIHFAFALATSWLIYCYLKRRQNKRYGMLGALLFLSTPVIVKLSITVYVDIGLIFFSIAAILLVFKWHEHDFRWRYLVMAGLCCGFGLGTKYNGLIVLVFLTALVAYAALGASAGHTGRLSRALAATAIFVAVAGLIYLPWGLKNYLWTGNPVYPVFDHWFNAVDPYEMQSVPPFVLRKLLYGESWWEILLVPLRIFFQGQDHSPQYFDGKLNPVLLVLPVLGFMAVNRETSTPTLRFEKTVLALFAVFFILFVFFQTDMRIRYVGPAIPCLVILAMFGFERLQSMMKKYVPGIKPGMRTGVTGFVIVVMFSGNLLYLIDQYQTVVPMQYLKGDLSRDQYIEKFRPEYGAIHHANTELPSGAMILALFIGNRGYYSEHAIRFDIDLFREAVQATTLVGDLHQQISHMGFSHMVIRFDMFAKWCHDNLNKKEKQMVKDLLQGWCDPILLKNGYGLFRLSNHMEPRPHNEATHEYWRPYGVKAKDQEPINKR